MKRAALTGFAIIVSFLFLRGPQAGPAEEKVKDGGTSIQAKFVGVANCKLCHADDATGNQFEKWKKSHHANALKTLQTPRAKEVGSWLGVTDPAKDAKCLRCHVTGAEAPKSAKARTFKETEGVGCESCHGAGELYAKDEVFKKGKEAAVALGLIEPDEKVCRKCHNKESPTYKDFDFKARLEKVRHPNPKLKKK